MRANMSAAERALHPFLVLWSRWDWGTRFSFVAAVVSLATLIGVLAQIARGDARFYRCAALKTAL
jgi:hypothetical protein